MSNGDKPGAEKTAAMGVRLAAFAYHSRRRIATGLAVVVAVFLGYHVVFGQNGLSAYQQKKLEDRTLSQQIRGLKEENSKLTDHVSRLQNSPDAIEHEAREKLHYARPGEVIYTLNDRPAGDDRTAAPPAEPAATEKP